MKTGPDPHPPKYMKLLHGEDPEAREIDPSFVITHKLKLEDAPKAAYKTFRDKQDGCIKVVLKP